jgi:hypothetical protein
LDLSHLSQNELLEWVLKNEKDISSADGEGLRIMHDRVLVDMKPFGFYVNKAEPHFINGEEAEPDYVELYTNYNPAEEHPWAAKWFEVIRHHS